MSRVHKSPPLPNVTQLKLKFRTGDLDPKEHKKRFRKIDDENDDDILK